MYGQREGNLRELEEEETAGDLGSEFVVCASSSVCQNLVFWLINPAALIIVRATRTDEAQKPSFAFSWLGDNNTFEAGGIAIINIKLLGNFESGGNLTFDKNLLDPTLTVNWKTGNSSYISGVSSNFEGDPSNWRIFFTPISVGIFNVVITDDHFGILDSSLHFQVIPGRVYPSACVASWMGIVNEFVAGTKATVVIHPKDAFGNNISSTSKEENLHIFTVSAFFANGSMASLLNVTYMGWNKLGYVSFEFIVATSGSLLLHIGGGNQTLNGSPLPFKVTPGQLDVSKCEAEWNFGTNSLQLFSKMELFIHQKDQYGNLVPGMYAFDAQVVEKGTNLSIPVADLHFEEVVPGLQLLTSSEMEPGNFKLMVYDMKQNKSISKMPYDFTVFVGYCDGLNSIINGSGLNNSVAGEVAKFSVYLNDIYQYPSPVELERLQVQIVRVTDSYHVWPSIYPIQIFNGSEPTGKLSYGAISSIEIAPAPSLDTNNISTGNMEVQASAYDVIYTPEKSGMYGINVFCGNIPLNGGHSFRKEVKAGEVDISLSGVVKFAPKVPKLIKNEVLVQLLDSFFNPVLSQQSRLKLEIGSVNSSGFQTWMFVDNGNGSYVGNYLAKDVGTYELCASFDGNRFSPCPFGVNVYSSEYFPKAYNDTISVWEDESIAFDALANDYFAGGNASIIEFSKPDHGSLLQYGHLFRYTPYKGFFGNDSFLYTMSDVNGNLATGVVNISVLSIPPQFVSFPSLLEATEDMMSPRFGGFPGFVLRYSDVMENISVTLSAQSGTVFLSPMLMQFGQPLWNGLSVNKGDGGAMDLILQGSVEAINLALQSIQYLGNENFSGDDIIQLSTMNRNGVNDLKVPVFVEPVNDPPFINVPDFIILKSDGDGSLIFDRDRDKFKFSIGDPDLLNFPGGESQFVVTFSMEVTSGILVTNLPAELTNSTELKLKNSYQWQPLQTFVTISKHFTVRAKGVRFRGTINECNSIMQQLLYHGGEHGAVLTVTLNDMGNYGCYPDCAEKISMPLYAEATVNLIRRRPMSSLVAHTLGSAVVIEFIMVLSLGVILVFFTCKCAIVLMNERSSQDIKDVEPSRVQSFHKKTSSTNLSQDATYFTGCCSSPILLSSQPSNFRQRSRRQYGNGESSKDAYPSSESSSGHLQQTPVRSLMPLSIEKGQSETL